MLNIMVCVNEDLIDVICIHNTGETEDGETYTYEILDPLNGKKIFDKTIAHKRSDGYKPLLVKACNLLEKYKVENFFG